MKEAIGAKVQESHERAVTKWEQEKVAARQRGETNFPPRPIDPWETPIIGRLYEQHLRPFIPYGVRGVLWDQGESGTGGPIGDQFVVMGVLMRNWRNDWGQGEFPFIVVQKPSGGGCAWDPADPLFFTADPFSPAARGASNYPDEAFRGMYVRIMKHPGTFLSITSDLGGKLHPLNKSGYGFRAARVALGGVYKRGVEYYGPVYESHAVEGGKVRVTFMHVGHGLAYKHGDRLQGFVMAGADRKFHGADAAIDRDTVVLSCPQVQEPIAIRYAWAKAIPWANLFTKDGLPAVTFRTDDWEFR